MFLFLMNKKTKNQVNFQNLLVTINLQKNKNKIK